MKRWEQIPDDATDPETISLQPDFTITAHVWRNGNQIVGVFHRPLIHAPVGVAVIGYCDGSTDFGMYGGVSYKMALALDGLLREDVVAYSEVTG